MLTESNWNPLGDYARGAKSPYDDDVRGVIIGGDFLTGRVFYDGREQRYQAFYADTEEELIAQAREFVEEMKAKFKDSPCYLYPDDSKWELRIYN